MATLIASYNYDGCTGRCDAKCYNASHPKCECICRGINHGKGLQTAVDNTRELADTWIESWKIEHPDEHVKVQSAVVQQKLF